MDWIKLALVGPIFLLGAPMLGWLLRNRPVPQRFVFGVLCFMTINGLFGPENWGLTLGSIEAYRGHTKGYHFYFNHARAIALLTARWLEAPRQFHWLPPGMGLYLFYCFCSCISLLTAEDASLVLMTAHKMLFASVIFMAGYHTLKTREDMQFFVRVMVYTMLWQFIVVLKLKYLHGIYQVRGTFEHQNPLAMYSVQIGMVFLATAMGPKFRGANRTLIAFLATAFIVQSTYSRAGLAMFAAGSIGVLSLSLMERPTLRRIVTGTLLGFVGVAGVIYSMDRVIERFHDRANIASGELRTVMNKTSREMVGDHPFGIGCNNYALMVNPPYRYAEIYFDWDRDRGMPVDETKTNPVVESHYYLLLAENGYLGLFSYFVLIGVSLFRNVRSFFYFGHSFERCLSLGIGAGCALNYAQSTLERVLTQPRNLMLWLLLLGITGRLETWRRVKSVQQDQRRVKGEV